MIFFSTNLLPFGNAACNQWYATWKPNLKDFCYFNTVNLLREKLFFLGHHNVFVTMENWKFIYIVWVCPALALCVFMFWSSENLLRINWHVYFCVLFSTHFLYCMWCGNELTWKLIKGLIGLQVTNECGHVNSSIPETWLFVLNQILRKSCSLVNTS